MGEAGVQRGMRGSTGKCWPARPPEREVRPQRAEHPILRNHLKKLTDLNASPGVHRTVPENSVQLCTPGWSTVPGEKMPSGKILGSVLGKQRQTHGRESQGGWMRGTTASWGLWSHVLPKGILHVTLKLLLTPGFSLMTWE